MRHSGQTLRIASKLQLQQDITSRQCWETESEINSVVSEHNGFYCCYLPESSFWTFHLFFFLLRLTSPLFWSLSRWGASKLRCYQAVRGSLDCFPERALKKVIPVCLPKTQTTLVARSHFSHVPFPSFLLNTHSSPPTVVSATICCH